MCEAESSLKEGFHRGGAEDAAFPIPFPSSQAVGEAMTGYTGYAAFKFSAASNKALV